MSREEIRGVAHAIAKAEAQVFKDELVARLGRLEERLAVLERKPAPAAAVPPAPITAPLFVAAPVQPPAPAPVAPAALVAPTPPPAPIAVEPVAPAALPAPVAAPAALPSVPVALDSIPVAAPSAPPPTFDVSFDADMAHPFKSSRRRIGVILVVIMVLAVSSIVVAAMISQSINNHSH